MLTATQNVIRNKFEKLHADRLEREQDVEQTLKPIAVTSTKSILIKSNNNPNALCDELRKLLLLSSDKQSIDDVLKELRDLDIIV